MCDTYPSVCLSAVPERERAPGGGGADGGGAEEDEGAEAEGAQWLGLWPILDPEAISVRRADPRPAHPLLARGLRGTAAKLGVHGVWGTGCSG